MSLDEIIKEKIRGSGAISIAEYMELALAHPEYGYYMTRDPLGAKGDFTTSPEISQVFGEVIGAWLAQQWVLLGTPTQMALVELGAGRGTLMADILRATKNVKGFHEAISVHIVEISPTLRQKQWKTLAGKHQRIEWHESIDYLPKRPLLLFANEFFDALPIRQFVACKDGWRERKVGIDDNGLKFVIPDLIGDIWLHISLLPASLDPRAEAGMTLEICEPAIEITKNIANHIIAYGGAALIIDYGYIGFSKGDTLQAMKNHKYHPVLEGAGTADITAHVDFKALAEAARDAGAVVHGAVPQGAFLMRIGAGERTTALCMAADHAQQKNLISGLKRLADPKEMGELFKVLAITSKEIGKAEGF